jgi:MYXO-CTERM domain-containing protein
MFAMNLDAGDDVSALLRQLEEEHALLATDDCSTACRALGSIQRAADKICSLEPGDRCSEARAKAAEAARRVREACPACNVAAAKPTTDEDDEVRRTGAPTAIEARQESAPRRGGCAGCATPGAPTPGAPGALLVAAWAATRIRRSRRPRP